MVTPESVNELRQQLRNLGYLNHGVERWFELDPWRSRTFWSELALVSLKAATLLFVLLAAPLTAVLALQNRPMSFEEVATAFALYAVTSFVTLFSAAALLALLFRIRPALAVENPRATTAVSAAAAALVVLLFALWWSGFEGTPGRFELLTTSALLLLFFGFATTVLAAVLLSLSIHATRRIPTVRDRSRRRVISGTAVVLVLALLLPAFFRTSGPRAMPSQVVITPRTPSVAFLAVDGLTFEIASARRDFTRLFQNVAAARPIAFSAPPELWATIGTGTNAQVHGVHAVDGYRLAGSDNVLQHVSTFDLAIRGFGAAVGVARQEPLPPTARNRDFVWETLAARGVAVAAINWWTSEERKTNAIHSVAQESIFAAAATEHRTNAAERALAVDRHAIAAMDRAKATSPQFVTIYLPALDIVLNRIALDSATAVPLSVRALDQITSAVESLRAGGYAVIVVGMPGRGQSGSATIASTIPLDSDRSLMDVAPTLCDLYGFPASEEMPGRSLLAKSQQARIATYGDRERSASATRHDPEYYENLKSLGYVQ